MTESIADLITKILVALEEKDDKKSQRLALEAGLKIAQIFLEDVHAIAERRQEVYQIDPATGLLVQTKAKAG